MAGKKLADAQRALNAARDTAKRRAMGRPLALTDANLDALSTVGEADVPAAEALWRQANPGPLGDLLDATPAEDGQR
jgi:tRNA A37 threonylcarbamoyladenosine synthetase subunit TsaC/SUA5/YrdC